MWCCHFSKSGSFGHFKIMPQAPSCSANKNAAGILSYLFCWTLHCTSNYLTRTESQTQLPIYVMVFLPFWWLKWLHMLTHTQLHPQLHMNVYRLSFLKYIYIMSIYFYFYFFTSEFRQQEKICCFTHGDCGDLLLTTVDQSCKESRVSLSCSS